MIYLGNSPVGVALKGVGKLTKYAKISVSPAIGNGILEFSNPLGVVPKLVVISSEVTASSRIVNCAFTSYVSKNGIAYNSSGGNYSQTTLTMVDAFDSTFCTAHVDATQVQIAKVSSSVGWVGTENTYTAELYA